MSRLHAPRSTRWALLLAAALLIVLAVPAGAWFSTSTSLTYTITSGDWDDDEDDNADDDLGDDPQEPDTSAEVWICKLVGPPHDPVLSQGENPRQVAAPATSDGRFSDQHGSPVVDEDFDCDELDLDDWQPPSQMPDPGRDGSDSTDTDGSRDAGRDDPVGDTDAGNDDEQNTDESGRDGSETDDASDEIEEDDLEQGDDADASDQDQSGGQQE